MAEKNENLNFDQRKESLEAAREYQKEMSKNLSSFLTQLNKEVEIRKEITNLSSQLNEITKEIQKEEEKGLKADRELIELLKKQRKEYELLIKQSSYMVENLSKGKALMTAITNESKELSKNFAKGILVYLNESDKSIKHFNLSLALSGTMADIFSKNLTEGALAAAHLGASLQDMILIQKTFSEEIGGLVSLNKKELENVYAISKIGDVGVETASKMVAKYVELGGSVDYATQGIEDTINNTRSMGLVVSNVLKKIDANIGKISQYNFKNGRKGLEEMVQYSEKYKVNMDSAFNTIEKSRTLEGALEMSSQLAVMGGNFAKADPFKLFFQSRNDVAAFTKEMNQMLKGIYSFNKATGDFSASAYEMDRLRAVAEATGRDYKELAQEATTLARIDMAKSQIRLPLGDKDKEMLTSMATMSKNGIFSIKVKGDTVDLSKLTNQQISLLKQEKEKLDTMVTQNQSFDELYKNFIMELKASLLPLLEQLNWVLSGVRSITSQIPENIKPILTKSLAGGALLLAGVSTLGPILKMFSFSLSSFKDIFSLGKKGGNITNTITNTVGSSSPDLAKSTVQQQAFNQTTSNPAVTSGNYARAASIAAIGVAALGIGAGIMLATKGFSGLANSISKLSPEQLNTLSTSIISLSVVFGGLIVGLGVLAYTPAGPAAIGMLMGLGGAFLALGGGIGIASAGIGYMLDKFTKLNESVVGLQNVNFKGMETGFKIASDFLTKDDSNLVKLKETLETISKMDFSNIKPLKELKNIIEKGIEVRFAKGQEANLVVHNHIVIDNQKFALKNTEKAMLEIKRKNVGL